MIARMIFSLLLLAGILLPLPAAAQPAPSRDQANAALRKAVQFFRQQISIEGGYLWQYSSDLSLREGEGKATATEAWVQSPGTPTVGLAYLNAYHRTGESYSPTPLARPRLRWSAGSWFPVAGITALNSIHNVAVVTRTALIRRSRVAGTRPH